jgi:hypothetical protein
MTDALKKPPAPPKYGTREEWLVALVEKLRPICACGETFVQEEKE